MRLAAGLPLFLAWLGLGCAACAPVPRAPAPPGIERIVFVGDSLVYRSDNDHGLLARVRQLLARTHPGRVFELVNAGENGDCIADIRSRLQRDVLDLAPSAVVLYWDSDAADVENADDPPPRTAALRAAYEVQLAAVLDRLRSATPRVVVAGPTLYGEQPHGTNPKDHVLDAYAAINHRLAQLHHATWVDTRRVAFHELRRAGSAPLTEDGEHLSTAGTSLLADELGSALSRLFATEASGAPVAEAP